MGKIIITGVGVITSIGDNLKANHEALKNGICGIGKLENFSTVYSASRPFGEIKWSDSQLISQLNVTNSGVSRTSLLALHAFNQAIADAKFDNTLIQSSDTALILGNTVGGMCLTETLYRDANAVSEGSPYLESYDCGSVALYLQEKYGIKGWVNNINTACSSATNAIMMGARMLHQGLAKRVIVGGVDSLAKFTINGFNALHILSPEICRPFDVSRQGLNLGEGAAFLILEKEEDAQGLKRYAEITGYANANDAYHPSTLSENGDGPYLAMKLALENAGLQANEIDYINTHGTATENNDLVESVAIKNLFHDKIPAFSSTKSNTGHTLGASGAIEAVYCMLMLQNQELYPSLNFSEPIPETKLVPVLEYKKTPLQHIQSNAFGFGGNCSSIIFSALK